jgi:hypothetical protein
MKRNTLIISIALIAFGFITARVGDSLSTVVPTGEEGAMMVQDSILMPIGAILFTLGLLALVVAIIWYLIDFIRAQLKKDQA